MDLNNFRRAILKGSILNDYFVDSNGNVWSAKSGSLKQLVSHCCDKNPYPRVRMDIFGKKQTVLVHRVVCETYYKKPIPKIYTRDQWNRLPEEFKTPLLEYLQHADQWQVNHIDHNKQNYHPSNLEWVSGKQNIDKYHEHRKNVNKEYSEQGVLQLSF